MSKQRLTVFQKLNNIFGPTGVQSPRIQANRYTIGNDAILKTTDKSEFELAKLQAQQNKYVGGMWRKVDNEMFQKTLHYETTRIGSYSDFETMEFYPEIAAALDIFMEESVTTNSKGKILNIYSESKRIEAVLEDLFFNRLDIHLSLPMWVRNVVKYGDNFLYLKIDPEQGVVGARPPQARGRRSARGVQRLPAHQPGGRGRPASAARRGGPGSRSATAAHRAPVASLLIKSRAARNWR